MLDEDGQSDIIEGPFDEGVPVEDREYTKPRAAPVLEVDDSFKFGSAPKMQ